MLRTYTLPHTRRLIATLPFATLRPILVQRITHRYATSSAKLASPPQALKTKQQPAPTAPPTPAFLQLQRLGELIDRVSAENSKARKQVIIAEYPDLRELLEHIYDRHARTHLTSAGLTTFCRTYSPTPPPSSVLATPTLTLLDLLTHLSTRASTGHKAFELILTWMAGNQVGVKRVFTQGKGEKEGEVLMRVLYRNLKAGFGANTLLGVPWAAGTVGSGTVAPLPAAPKPAKASTTASQTTTPDPPKQSPNLIKFSPSLGHTLLPSALPTLFTFTRAPTSLPLDTLGRPQVDWYVSRKLDGVRVLLVIDVELSGRVEDGVTVKGMKGLSRSGREFTSLDVLKKEVREGLDGWEGLKGLVDVDGDIPPGSKDKVIKSLVIDGELCALIPAPIPTGSPPPPPGEPIKMIESFSTISSLIRQKSTTIPSPLLFLLDVLPYSEFCGTVLPAARKSFRARLDDCKAVLGKMKQKEKGVLREVEQVPVTGVEGVEEMVGMASREGWEGLILRRDVFYEGKRTKNIRKFKEWQDAEYTVLAVDTGFMRMSVDGVFKERMGMTNVWIEHKGTRVSVGSGFTTDQRIRFGEDPGLIIGKEMTVEYFAESTNNERGEDGGLSLRFPRVKTVWEDGKRDI